MSATPAKPQIRTITQLIRLDTGDEVSAIPIVFSPEEQAFKHRNLVEKHIQSGNPLYGCGECGQPVVMRTLRTPERSHAFYFKHMRGSDDCPIKTGSSFTKDEVRSMKYNGAKESTAHIELKQYLTHHLEQDDRFTEIRVEKVVKGKGWSRKWKKPDISAKFNGKPVVFEIQLSTTFLDVIVSREAFYQSEGIAIFWIFKDLAPDRCRATEKDVFFNNQANALSVDQQSKELPEKERKLVLTGHYRKATLRCFSR